MICMCDVYDYAYDVELVYVSRSELLVESALHSWSCSRLDSWNQPLIDSLISGLQASEASRTSGLSYVHACCFSICIYIYIYIQRERERESAREICVQLHEFQLYTALLRPDVLLSKYSQTLSDRAVNKS